MSSDSASAPTAASSGVGSQSTRRRRPRSAIEKMRGWLPVTAQTAPSVASSRIAAGASSSASVRRSTSARLPSSGQRWSMASIWSWPEHLLAPRRAQVHRPAGLGRARGVALPRPLELQRAVLAHRLEHPVAHRAVDLDHGEQRLVDQAVDHLGAARPEHGDGGRRGRSRRGRPTARPGRAAPRARAGPTTSRSPRSGSGGGPGAVRSRPRSSAKRSLERAAYLLGRHGADPGRGQLDGERAARRAAPRCRPRRPAGGRRPGVAARARRTKSSRAVGDRELAER